MSNSVPNAQRRYPEGLVPVLRIKAGTNAKSSTGWDEYKGLGTSVEHEFLNDGDLMVTWDEKGIPYRRCYAKGEWKVWEITYAKR